MKPGEFKLNLETNKVFQVSFSVFVNHLKGSVKLSKRVTEITGYHVMKIKKLKSKQFRSNWG